MKYTIAKPYMMDNIITAKHNPNVIISILIAIAIYVAYFLISLIASIVYGVACFVQNPEIMQGSFDKISNKMVDILSSQEFTLISFYLMAFIILFVIIEVRFIEKRALSTIGLSRKRFAGKYLAGFGVGALLIAVNIVPEIIIESSNITYNGYSPLVLISLFAFIIQTASEEIIFRGYLLTSFGHIIGMFWAAILSSFLFALLHIHGDATILDVTSIFFIGLFLSFYMIRTNNIWGVFGIHTAWNFILGCITKIKIGPISLDYSIIQVGDPDAVQNFGIIGDPMLIISIAIFVIGIAYLLFVGKNKIVRKVEIQADENEGESLEA